MAKEQVRVLNDFFASVFNNQTSCSPERNREQNESHNPRLSSTCHTTTSPWGGMGWDPPKEADGDARSTP